MVDISPEQYRLLKDISRKVSVSSDSMAKNEKEICDFLVEKGFLSASKNRGKTEDGELNLFYVHPAVYSITQSGKAQIYAFKSTFYKWWIPVIISIAAIVISLSALLFEISERRSINKAESLDISTGSTGDIQDVPFDS